VSEASGLPPGSRALDDPTGRLDESAELAAAAALGMPALIEKRVDPIPMELLAPKDSLIIGEALYPCWFAGSAPLGSCRGLRGLRRAG
jgi:hypothetical protein